MHTVQLGMPHLNYNGLDEVWLLKETGNLHWSKLYDIVDVWLDDHTRSYASFFKVAMEFDTNQSVFAEGDTLTIDSGIRRFNSKIYRSEHLFRNQKGYHGRVSLDSIFVLKGDDNNLSKFEPRELEKVEQIDDVDIGRYQDAKRLVSDTRDGMILDFSPVNLYNGVKLLYCANYLYLSELSEYKHLDRVLSPIKSMELFYFNNVMINDKVYGRSEYHAEKDAYHTTLFTKEKTLSHARIKR